MSSNNILYICNTMLKNVVITSDANGKNELNRIPKFKYNQHLVNRCINNLKKDSVLINDTVHSDCVIIVDEHGNNVLKSRDEIWNKNTDENNLFIEVLKQVHVDKEPANIEEFLLKKRESLQSKLKTATYYFDMKSFIKASALYKEVLTMIETDIYPDEFMLKDSDILAIKFAYALSNVAIRKATELTIAADVLTALKTEHGDEYPTIYYYLGRCFFLLDKHQDAKKAVNTGLNVLKNIEFLSELNWPGSDIKMIVRKEKSLLEENLQKLLKEYSEYRIPDIKCLFLECDNKNIFFDSPCFNGYVIVKCSSKCNFTYHRNCWKKKLKVECVKKPSYLLGTLCATDDCDGIISEILIYDENLHPNTYIVPKTIKPDKHEEKIHSSNDKCAKKSINEKHKSIPKKNVGNECGATKKATFNLNAKEYVPVNKQEIKLNMDAKEYVPPELNSINNNADSEGRANLFDNVPSVHSFMDHRIAEMTTEPDAEFVRENEQISELNADIIKLGNELIMVRKQLFQVEEENNALIAQNNIFQKQWQEALVKSKKCDNCEKLQKVVSQNESEKSSALMKLKQLEQKNDELTCQLKELQNALNLEQQEKKTKIEYNENLQKKNEILQGKVDELLSKMKVMSQQYAYMTQHDNMNLRKAMFDQIACIRHAYASYFTLYENRSKHMLWELEDIKALSSGETVPTLAEVEENLGAWRHALDNSVKGRYMMNNFYDHLFRQFSNEGINGGPPTPLSFPSFIVEPPNIIMRHFKSLIIVNKRLEQELHQQMNTFYKMISTPYPGVFPQKNPETVLQMNTSENISEPQVVPTPKSELPKWDSATSATTNMYDNLVKNTTATATPIGSTSRKITKQSLLNSNNSNNNASTTDDDINSKKENYSNDGKIGAIPKKPDVIGLDSLVNKLHEKLPLVPVNLISRAVNILRERSGGLTGKDSRQIIAEIKQILKEIAITEKCLRKNKTLPEEKPVKTWKKVNNGVHWNNEDPDVNCTICFEFMPPDKRLKLRCQHIFHQTCIKLWLQNDSICPICRSFATLDDEYPPLK